MSLFVAEGLSVRFGGLMALDGVSFKVEPGQIFTIIGPNGAGKTTIFNLISRIYEPTAGRMSFDGQDMTRVAPHAVADLGIARTFQNIELFEHATVLHNLLLGRHSHRRNGVLANMLFGARAMREELDHRAAAEKVIDFLDLEAHRDSPISGLPYGVRKVVELGRALCMNPRLLLLDEPSSGLNVEETEDMGFWIQDIRDEFGVTVLMVEHDMKLVTEVSDHVLAISYGRMLAEGTAAEVQSHHDVVTAYLGQAAS